LASNTASSEPPYNKGVNPKQTPTRALARWALAYAFMESQVAGRAVTAAEVCDDRLNACQQEINDSLGL
tara:strand:- start:631 stop:837 length:207 start_codon:yes stop_codon:yes gene_type:complete